jgi:hypothetical protein
MQRDMIAKCLDAWDYNTPSLVSLTCHPSFTVPRGHVLPLQCYHS